MRAVVVLVSVAALVGACSFIPGIGTPQACPAALLEGRLVADGHGSAAVETEFGTTPVRWPDGYHVDDGDEVALLDERGNLVATEGEIVYVGGGMNATDDVFIACGYVSRDPP